MKDHLFEFLLNLFEKTLNQLKEKSLSIIDTAEKETLVSEGKVENEQKTRLELEFIKESSPNVIRVFTEAEQTKLTRASYQFLMRLQATNIIHSGTMELIINRLMFSESRYVSLRETKWIIRNTLMDTLNVEQLTFLELILYQKEDGVRLH